MPKKKLLSSYWECRLCRNTWSSHIDITEMREHYLDDHTEIDLDTLVTEDDFMQMKVSTWSTKKKSVES